LSPCTPSTKPLACYQTSNKEVLMICHLDANPIRPISVGA
jgi:hypothetical protein